MRLDRPYFDPREREGRRRDLTLLLDQPSSRELRPCKDCSIPCPCSSSPVCTCRCGPACEQAPIQMSSDGDRYPVESKVAPLVYAFYCLRLCPPYWSCEGHVNQAGGLVRLPQVWFYSRSSVYPRLIADGLAALRIQGRLVHPWHLCVCYTDHALDAGFSLEPDVKWIERPDLARLQGDLGVIADRLVPVVRDLAKTYSTNHLSAV